MLGGCLCGAIRYHFTAEPKASVNCHCSMCRRHSGAAFLTYVAIDRSAFHLDRGVLVDYRSSDAAVRSHCGICGSPLTFVFDAEPDSVWVTAGTLDNPDAVPPTQNWFASDKVQWTKLDAALKAWPGLPEPN